MQKSSKYDHETGRNGDIGHKEETSEVFVSGQVSQGSNDYDLSLNIEKIGLHQNCKTYGIKYHFGKLITRMCSVWQQIFHLSRESVRKGVWVKAICTFKQRAFGIWKFLSLKVDQDKLVTLSKALKIE